MSRCFPFQPRGYEKKHRPEEGDLLKEEKRKEKKHKREKKDKEKREGKEKRDKDRSDGKHREKKEKKDKHRDKKEKHKDKKKDKDKDKEKSSISEEARLAVPPGSAASSGGKLHDRDEHKDRQIGFEKAKIPNQFHVQHGEKPVKRSLSAVEVEESKFVQELGRRIRDEEKGGQSQLAERFPVEWKRDDKSDKVGGIRVLGNLGDMEKNKEKGSDNHKMDAQAFRGEHRIGANAISPSLSTVAKSSSEGIPRPFEENVGKKREEKQKPKEKRDDKPREKNKDKEREKQSHRKQKDKEKEKKKEEKAAKDKSEHKKSQEDKSKDNNKNDFVVLSNNKLPLVSKENIAGTATEGIVKKRKNVETNGFLHESELRPAKLLRPSSSQQPIQNGKKLDTHQKADLFSSINRGVASDIKAENKEHKKVNGNIEGPQLFSVKAKASFMMIPGGDQVAEVSEIPLPPSVKAKASSVIPGADQIFEASKTPLPSVKAKAASVIPGVDQIAEASKMPLPSVKAKASSVIPGADRIAEASQVPLPSVKARASSVIPGADQIAEASKIPLPSVKAKAASVIPGVDQMIAEACKRPPHPDSKHLSHVLSVPKMDDWLGLDDQEWLSGSKRPPTKSATEMCPDEVNKEHYVWSEALQIDTADVCALPYVIPY